MALFKRREPKPDAGAAPATVSDDAAEHAVIVHFKLSGPDYGTEAEREAIYALQHRLEVAIDAAGAGEFDGNEFGGGEAVLYAYGPDATALFIAMEADLRTHEARPAYAILRFGEIDDPATIERRVEI